MSSKQLKVADLANVILPALNAYILYDICREEGAFPDERHPNLWAENRVGRIRETLGPGRVRKEKAR